MPSLSTSALLWSFCSTLLEFSSGVDSLIHVSWPLVTQLCLQNDTIASKTHTLQALQLDFYGDALVEAWRGTQHGEANVRCQDAPDIFKAHFGNDFDSHAWGMAGECPRHLQQSRHGGMMCSNTGSG